MSLYAWVQSQMESTYSYMSDTYPRELFAQLLEPQNIVEAPVTIEMDDGSTQTFQWRRSQHNNVKWPYKWGIRFHQNVSLDEVKSLSAWMSFKTSVVGLPLWWGKWWIIVDPKTLSSAELERLSRGYIDQVREHIWPEKDVPAPDVNTNGTIMWWMADQYAKHVWAWKPWVITWKPLSIWGSKWRWIATALWGLYVLQRYLWEENQELSWKRIVIQWAWNAWLTFAKLVVEQWAIVVWISDSKWGIYNEAWLDIAAIENIKQSRNSVTTYTTDGTEVVDQGDILTMPCDILVPAALELQITIWNADAIQAGIILELANGPTSPEADELLFKKWTVVLPDILANAGWVTVSYFEQVQNNMNFYRSETDVFDKLKTMMDDATMWVIETASTHTVSLRDAAYIVSMWRILEAMKVRGW